MADAEELEHQPQPATKPSGPKRIATIFAHPDDADFSCAGTCAHFVAQGHHVTHVIITNGDKGSDDRSISGPELVAIRERQQRAAADILGVDGLVFMGSSDWMLVPGLELRRDLVRVIRTIKPDVVICGDPGIFYMG